MSRTIESNFVKRLVDVAGLALHEIHAELLAEVVGSGEVGFAAAHLGDFLECRTYGPRLEADRERDGGWSGNSLPFCHRRFQNSGNGLLNREPTDVRA